MLEETNKVHILGLNHEEETIILCCFRESRNDICLAIDQGINQCSVSLNKDQAVHLEIVLRGLIRKFE